MTALLSPTARQLFLNPTTGQPASGYKLFTYEAGTAGTKQATYTDSTAGTPNTNPILLDSLGECDLWLTPDVGYKFVFAPPTDTDPPSNPIWTVDNIFGSPLTAPVSPWAIAGGTSDAITATYSPTVTSLPDGLLLGVRFSAANLTTTPTFRPDAQPAYVITDLGGAPLALGAIPGPLSEGLLRFNLAHTRWELLNPAVSNLAAGGQLSQAINAAMTLTAAAATGTFSADLVTVAVSLNGQAFALAPYSQAINLGTIGPGGMDISTAPLSGFVSLYAIYNPTSGTPSIMACAVATSTATIYAGANLPSGYTSSCLIGIWPTDGSGNFVVGALRGRHISIDPSGAFWSNSQTSWFAFSVGTSVPAAAVSVDGFANSSSVNVTQTFFKLASFGSGTTAGIGEVQFFQPPSSSAPVDGLWGSPFYNLSMITANTIYGRADGHASVFVYVSGYSW